MSNIAIIEGKKSINLIGVFSDKVIDFTNEPSMWHSFDDNDDDDDDDDDDDTTYHEQIW